MRKIRENLVVAKGNQSVYAEGLDVFGPDGKTYVRDGQLVVWDPKTNLSLGPDITCSDYDKIVISVGTATGKLRSCFGDVLYGCDVQAVNAEGPSCGGQDIWDIYIDDSITCNSVYTFTITVDDDDTRNAYPWNKPETYTFTVDTKDCACSTCESGFDAQKLACKMKDAVNGLFYNTLSRTKKAFFKNIPPTNDRKFTAHLLYGGANSNIVYCINPVAGTECEKCVDADVLIASMKYDTDTIVVFENTANEAGDATLISKLQSIVTQINTALDGKGSAALTKGPGHCCPWRLEINSCYADLELYADEGATDDLTACTVANDPFDPVVVTEQCPSCTSPSDLTFSYGIRIIGEPIIFGQYDYDSFPTNPVHGNLYRKIKIFMGKGFECGRSHLVHVQTASVPENLGYHFQWKEFVSAAGGSGRGHDPFVRQGYGPMGLPLKNGRHDAVVSNKKESYCSYSIEHSIPYRDQTVYGNHVSPRGTTIVLIPSTDTTTRTEFEAIINSYLPSCECPIKTAVSCA
jgi:hypothetical protein